MSRHLCATLRRRNMRTLPDSAAALFCSTLPAYLHEGHSMRLPTTRIWGTAAQAKFSIRAAHFRTG